MVIFQTSVLPRQGKNQRLLATKLVLAKSAPGNMFLLTDFNEQSNHWPNMHQETFLLTDFNELLMRCSQAFKSRVG
jgi:hypothetical protein